MKKKTDDFDPFQVLFSSQAEADAHQIRFREWEKANPIYRLDPDEEEAFMDDPMNYVLRAERRARQSSHADPR